MPELIVLIKRFHSAGELKLQTQVQLPRLLFAIARYQALYYVKYVAVHDGTTLAGGHYYAYERGTLQQDQDRDKPEAPSSEASAEEKHEYQMKLAKWKERSFQKWTMYEDDKKRLNQSWEKVQVSQKEVSR